MSLYEFYEKYFLINLKDYPNIGIDLEITKILFFFLVGFLVASIAISYLKSTMHLTVKKLMRRDAVTEQTALTLAELGIDSSRVRRALKPGTQLSRIVGRVGEHNYTYEEYIALTKSKDYKEEVINFDEARFYIRKEERLRAEKNFMTGDTSLLNTVLFCVLMVAIYTCLMFTMPSILNVINNLLG